MKHLADRHDALVGASRLVLAVRELAEAFESGQLLGSVGRFTVWPNSPVVVPGTVTLAVDLRSADPDVLDKAHEQFLAVVGAVNNQGDVEVDIDSLSLRPTTHYQPSGIALAEAAAERAGLSSRRMLTIAGHDSVNLKDVVPTVMLFVPSDAGISHNEAEHTADRDLLNGVTMLTEVVTALLTKCSAG
jgi:N-carbamoyl-L-amino-acid hydrolase